MADANPALSERCIDCDRPLRECSCEGRLRCSCGIPDEVCVCAGSVPVVSTQSSGAVPVEEGQIRQGQGGIKWGVLKAHPRRRGFFLCASHEFPYETMLAGRHELEALAIVDPGFFAPRGHLGLAYWRDFVAVANQKGEVGKTTTTLNLERMTSNG